MTKIILDKSAFPDLTECKVGDTYMLTGTATAVEGNQLTLDVTAAEPAEAEEAEPAEETEPTPSNPVSKIGMPGMKKSYA